MTFTKPMKVLKTIDARPAESQSTVDLLTVMDPRSSLEQQVLGLRVAMDCPELGRHMAGVVLDTAQATALAESLMEWVRSVPPVLARDLFPCDCNHGAPRRQPKKLAA